MSLHFRLATPADAVLIGTLVIELTEEICARTGARHFSIDTDSTIRQSHQLMSAGHYAVILGFEQDEAIAMAATSTTWALYAGGKVGVIQEFYVRPQARSGGIGAALLQQVRDYGQQQQWACIELCTPPLPEFERTLSFYQNNGLKAVGGRKMRQSLEG